MPGAEAPDVQVRELVTTRFYDASDVLCHLPVRVPHEFHAAYVTV